MVLVQPLSIFGYWILFLLLLFPTRLPWFKKTSEFSCMSLEWNSLSNIISVYILWLCCFTFFFFSPSSWGKPNIQTRLAHSNFLHDYEQSYNLGKNVFFFVVMLLCFLNVNVWNSLKSFMSDQNTVLNVFCFHFLSYAAIWRCISGLAISFSSDHRL